MADQPENLVLIQLREMRAEFGDLRTEMRKMRTTMDDKFKQHGKRLDDVMEAEVLAAGYASLAAHKFDALDNRMASTESRVELLEARSPTLQP